MQKVISFSIAAYNIEVYAKQLLDSFIDEKTMDEIEVLIINDGSNDQTVNICQEYVNKYPNVFRLINKENGGHGSTINKGIKIAKGKYFKPIDGDDWIKTTNLPKIIKILKQNEVDMVVTDYDRIYEKSNVVDTITNGFLIKNKVMEFDFIHWKSFLHFHAVIYKTSLLRDHNVKLTEKVFYDDTEYVLYPIIHVFSVLYIPLVLYCYRLESEGQSVSLSGFLKHKDDLKLILTNSFKFCTENEERVSNAKKTYFKYLQRGVLAFLYRNYLCGKYQSSNQLEVYKKSTVDSLKQICGMKFYKYWFYSICRVRVGLLLKKIKK